MTDRKCVGCGTIKDRGELIKITAQNPHNDIIVNGGSKIFGRSAYLCYNNTCIENAFKKNKLKKALRTPIKEDLKGIILNEL